MARNSPRWLIVKHRVMSARAGVRGAVSTNVLAKVPLRQQLVSVTKSYPFELTIVRITWAYPAVLIDGRCHCADCNRAAPIICKRIWEPGVNCKRRRHLV